MSQQQPQGPVSRVFGPCRKECRDAKAMANVVNSSDTRLADEKDEESRS